MKYSVPLQVQTVAVPDGTIPSTSVGYSVPGQTILMMDPSQGVANGAMVTSAVQALPNGVQTLALPSTNPAPSNVPVSSFLTYAAAVKYFFLGSFLSAFSPNQKFLKRAWTK